MIPLSQQSAYSNLYNSPKTHTHTPCNLLQGIPVGLTLGPTVCVGPVLGLDIGGSVPSKSSSNVGMDVGLDVIGLDVGPDVVGWDVVGVFVFQDAFASATILSEDKSRIAMKGSNNKGSNLSFVIVGLVMACCCCYVCVKTDE